MHNCDGVNHMTIFQIMNTSDANGILFNLLKVIVCAAVRVGPLLLSTYFQHLRKRKMYLEATRGMK